GDFERRAAALRVQSHAQTIVHLLLSGEVRRELDLFDRHVRLSFFPKKAVRRLAAGTLGDEPHHAEVLAEAHREPAVVAGVLPVARPPRVIAQAEAVDRVLALADLERSLRRSVLLEVAARELRLRV